MNIEKIIKEEISLLREGYEQLLYHFTTISALGKILVSQELKPTFLETISQYNFSKKSGNVCFTRTKYPYDGYQRQFLGHSAYACIEFDRDIINSRGVLRPYDYLYMNTRKSSISPNNNEAEYEDRLFTNKPISIKNAIVAIDIICNFAKGIDIEDLQKSVTDKQKKYFYSIIDNGEKSFKNVVNEISMSLRNLNGIDVRFYQSVKDFYKGKQTDFNTIVQNYQDVFYGYGTNVENVQNRRNFNELKTDLYFVYDNIKLKFNNNALSDEQSQFLSYLQDLCDNAKYNSLSYTAMLEIKNKAEKLLEYIIEDNDNKKKSISDLDVDMAMKDATQIYNKLQSLKWKVEEEKVEECCDWYKMAKYFQQEGDNNVTMKAIETFVQKSKDIM